MKEKCKWIVASLPSYLAEGLEPWSYVNSSAYRTPSTSLLPLRICIQILSMLLAMTFCQFRPHARAQDREMLPI
ncbi:hypothetical protein VTO42DRAFT_5583 [Malbranchea cinnamomea]